MQEVIAALAGWRNIMSGGIFRAGDPIRIAGVRRDVIDMTPLRTKVIEIGSPETGTWVKGRQYTGRIVAISNKATFTEPVSNYSSSFESGATDNWNELLARFIVPVRSPRLVKDRLTPRVLDRFRYDGDQDRVRDVGGDTSSRGRPWREGVDEG